MLLNLSEQQAVILDLALQLEGHVPPTEQAMRCERLVQRALLALQDGRPGYRTTDFGKAALNAYRQAEKVGQVKEVR